MENNTFEILNGINVNNMVEKKQTGGSTLTYLSWAAAWKVAKEQFPEDIEYEIERNPETNLPYWYDPMTGYMVFTKITLDKQTHEMWLPVMDGTNHAMKAEPYEVQTKYKKFTVAAATMTDINKTIMRCLVKNLAMFGLGLYIYQGEDIPSAEQAQPVQTAQPANKPVEKAIQPQMTAQAPVRDTRPVTVDEIKTIRQQVLNKYEIDEEWICRKYKAHNLQDLMMYQFQHVMSNADKLKSMFDTEKKAEKQQQLIDIMKQSKQAQAEARTDDLTLNEATNRSSQQGKDDSEPIDLESLGLTEADLNILAEAGNIFS